MMTMTAKAADIARFGGTGASDLRARPSSFDRKAPAIKAEGVGRLGVVRPVNQEACITQRLKNDEQVRLHVRWRPALMAFFVRRLRNHAEAEDLTQDVFVRMLRSDITEGAPSHYIFQIAQNLLVDRARSASVRQRYREAIGTSDDLKTDPLDPERVALGRAELARFGAALDALPERTRAMFTLYRIDQTSQDLIAESFGISKSAVKKQIASAKASIMVRMRDEA